MTSTNGRNVGLARAELLFVFSVLLLFGSLLFPLGVAWRDHYFTRKAFAEMRRLITAAEFFRREYQIWPVPGGVAPRDLRVGGEISNRHTIDVLAAREPRGSTLPPLNRSGLDFLEMAATSGATAPLRLNPSGEVIDPWGTPYHFVFDANYDNVVVIPDSSSRDVVGEGLLAWSCGPDRRPDTSDDLRSWFP